jgi:hypothetical protein
VIKLKKTLYLFSLILLFVGCANSQVKNFKSSSLEGKKTVIIEEIVEETSDSILGERTKKIIKRTPTTTEAITLSEQNNFEDENFAINFVFNSNNIDISIKNKSETDGSFFTDYSYYQTLDNKKYRMFLLESWKGSSKSIRTQISPVITKSSTTVLNFTPESCIDFSAGTGAENYTYWQRGTLLSTTIGKKAVQDYVEILIPIKLNSNIYSYLFKVKLSK